MSLKRTKKQSRRGQSHKHNKQYHNEQRTRRYNIGKRVKYYDPDAEYQRRKAENG